MRANTLTAASAMIQKMRHGMVFMFHPARRRGTREAPMHDVESCRASLSFECELHDERPRSDGESEGAMSWRSWSGLSRVERARSEKRGWRAGGMECERRAGRNGARCCRGCPADGGAQAEVECLGGRE